jgi:hypothetical protein
MLIAAVALTKPVARSRTTPLAAPKYDQSAKSSPSLINQHSHICKDIIYMKTLQLFNLVALMLLASCGWPIAPERMPEVMESLSRDKATGCFWIAGRGGAGSVAVTPMPIPGGGYGSGEVLMGRVNSANTQLIIKNGECHITSGDPAPVPAEPGVIIVPVPSAQPPATSPTPSAIPIDYRFIKVETPPANPCDWSWVICR